MEVKDFVNVGKPVPGTELKKIKQNIKLAQKNAVKWAADQTEIYKHIGSLYHALGKNNHAVGWWERAVANGTTLGAQLEAGKAEAELKSLSSGD
ncbi:MAG: hypothetical protein E4H36_14115 [Spirochaetales bacterium]|nr:MAG: hypothetical protein E4H36_14115 [Spirochaetales bacterium]